MDLSAIGVPDSIVTKVSVLGLTSVNRLPWKACDELGWKYIFDHSGLNLGEFTLLRNTVIAWNELYPPEKPSIGNVAKFFVTDLFIYSCNYFFNQRPERLFRPCAMLTKNQL